MPDSAENPVRAFPDHRRLVQLCVDPKGNGSTWTALDGEPRQTLAAYTKQAGLLKLRDALAIFYQVADLVVHLHDHGVLHGYVLPETVFCTDNQHCSVGIVMHELPVAERELLAKRYKGFVASEIAQGVIPDSRSDVYSLAAMLHWMLVGKAPNGAVSRRLPPAIAHLIQRAVELDPTKRSQTISALVDGLQSIPEDDLKRYEDELLLAVSAAGFDPRLLWSRHPRKVLASVAVMALLVAGAFWGHREYETRQAEKHAKVEKDTREQARLNSLRRRTVRAEQTFNNGQFRDAIEIYGALLRDDPIHTRREKALAQIARSYGALEDHGAEYTAWLRLLREYPDASASGEANERIMQVASLAVKRYGHLIDVTTTQDIIVDGFANDWTGIEPVATDPVGDNRRGGPASDMTAFYVAVKGDRIFFRIDTAAPPNPGDQYCVAIDLNAFAYEDSAEEWDYQIGVARGIAPWIWDLRGSRSYDNTTSTKLTGVVFAQEQVVEFSVPLAAIGSPTSMGVRAFLNYAGMREANDVMRRKVLVRWERETPMQTGPVLIDGGQKVGKRE